MATSDFTVRVMTRRDLEEVIEWAAAEGWNPGLDDAACFHILDGRAHHPSGVDTRIEKKGRVFGGNGGVDKIRGNLIQPYPSAPAFVEDFRQQNPRAVIDAGAAKAAGPLAQCRRSDKSGGICLRTTGHPR